MKFNIGAEVIREAKQKGAAMAGIASVELLRESPSHQILRMKTGLEIKGFGGIRWPEDAKSALVIAVAHPENKPELDWWDGKSSPGNDILIRIIRELSIWIREEFGIRTQEMPYDVERGGIYLKDAAVLAGLGCIGRNNLLITPELGPRVRLRAMLLSEELSPTGPISFDPCKGCREFCRKECPQDAFAERILSSSDVGMANLPGRDGFFSWAKCLVQMSKDIENSAIDPDEKVYLLPEDDAPLKCIKYCRRCELSCPIGK